MMTIMKKLSLRIALECLMAGLLFAGIAAAQNGQRTSCAFTCRWQQGHRTTFMTVRSGVRAWCRV